MTPKQTRIQEMKLKYQLLNIELIYKIRSIFARTFHVIYSLIRNYCDGSPTHTQSKARVCEHENHLGASDTLHKEVLDGYTYHEHYETYPEENIEGDEHTFDTHLRAHDYVVRRRLPHRQYTCSTRGPDHTGTGTRSDRATTRKHDHTRPRARLRNTEALRTSLVAARCKTGRRNVNSIHTSTRTVAYEIPVDEKDTHAVVVLDDSPKVDDRVDRRTCYTWRDASAA